MTVAQVGPFTELLESLAAAVGAGMLLGGFAIGFAAFAAGRSRRHLAERALADGYAGGFLGLGASVLDFLLR